jgi:hypothetical protein
MHGEGPETPSRPFPLFLKNPETRTLARASILRECSKMRSPAFSVAYEKLRQEGGGLFICEFIEGGPWLQ